MGESLGDVMKMFFAGPVIEMIVMEQEEGRMERDLTGAYLLSLKLAMVSPLFNLTLYGEDMV